MRSPKRMDRRRTQYPTPQNPTFLHLRVNEVVEEEEVNQELVSLRALRHAKEVLIQIRQVSTRRKHILPQCPSETEARLALITLYDFARKERDKHEREVQRVFGGNPTQQAVEAYLLYRGRRPGDFLDVVSSQFWQEERCQCIERHFPGPRNENTHVEAWLLVEKELCKPLYLPFMKHYFVPLLSYLKENRRLSPRFHTGQEVVYMIFTGFVAAHIKMYPSLEQTLQREYPQYAPDAALLWEIYGTSSLLASAMLDASLPLHELPGKVEKDIRQQYYTPQKECLVADLKRGGRFADPVERVIRR